MPDASQTRRRRLAAESGEGDQVRFHLADLHPSSPSLLAEGTARSRNDVVVDLADGVHEGSEPRYFFAISLSHFLFSRMSR